MGAGFEGRGGWISSKLKTKLPSVVNSVEVLPPGFGTIKNVIHDVTSRLGLKNRSHAVAFAVREGLI